ncbi:ImmA/IrrE family metallo-endopeptidase [Leuconostoc mesenteroides subsp. cremoris]|nr:ImmA/IrrE family metallo-endopeptidase [Leuconostoc mesenteroides subsp. cremoris]
MLCRNELACKNSFLLRDDLFIIRSLKSCLRNQLTSIAYNYRFAHEISHILYGDHDAQAVYQFSEYGKRGEELLVHKNAIRMLMSIEMPTNVNGFMEYYHVPSWLEHYADESFKSLIVTE